MCTDLTECVGCGYPLKLIRKGKRAGTWVCDCPLFESLGSHGSLPPGHDPASSFLGAKDATDLEYTNPTASSPGDLATHLFTETPENTHASDDDPGTQSKKPSGQGT